VEARSLLSSGVPLQSDGEVTPLKSPASNTSLGPVGSKYARSCLKKFSRSWSFSAHAEAQIFIIHASLKTPAIPPPNVSRLILLRYVPSLSSIAVPLLSMPSLMNAPEPQRGCEVVVCYFL